MSMWEFVDLGAATLRVRAQPEIDDVAAARSPGGRLYVLVKPQGMHYGPVLRDIVLDEIEAEHPDVAVAMVRDVPRVEDGAVDAPAFVALARQVVEDGRWVFAFEPPETPEETAVAALLLEILSTRRVSMTDSLPLLGADSLVLVELSAAITERFGVTVNAMDLFEVDSVRELTQLVLDTRSRMPV
jgi:acyl carrier protein